jgi:hypothetical protein
VQGKRPTFLEKVFALPANRKIARDYFLILNIKKFRERFTHQVADIGVSIKSRPVRKPRRTTYDKNIIASPTPTSLASVGKVSCLSPLVASQNIECVRKRPVKSKVETLLRFQADIPGDNDLSLRVVSKHEKTTR